MLGATRRLQVSLALAEKVAHCPASAAPRMRPARGTGACRAFSVPTVRSQAAGAEGERGGGGGFAFACGLAPTQVFAIGMNYASHAKEMAKPVPSKPIVFAKGLNTLIGDGEVRQ